MVHPPAALSQRAASSSSSPSTMITDLIKDFRWKAAQLITSNLDEKERSKLFHLTKEEATTTPTIGEAVAAARVEEAQKLNNQWKKQKEQLLMEAEEAARARVETEVQSVVVQEPPVTANEHAVLGPVVVDLGYKKIYRVSAPTLTAIPVWQKQRLYRHDRAKVILKDKLKTTHLGLPGIIVLHEVRAIYDVFACFSVIDLSQSCSSLKSLSIFSTLGQRWQIEYPRWSASCGCLGFVVEERSEGL